MCKKFISQFILITLLVIICLLLFSISQKLSYGYKSNEVEKIAKGDQNQVSNQYNMDEIDGVSNLFTNYVDGYSIKIPKDFRVNMENSQVVTSLKNSSCTIEIYKQPLKEGVSPLSYVNYSHNFLDNKVDHYLIKEETIYIVNFKTYVKHWTREKLKNVQNDRNNYVSCDIIVSENLVYTFLFKSLLPFDDENFYKNIINSFSVKTSNIEGMALRYDDFRDREGLSSATENVLKKYFLNEDNLTWGIFEPSAPTDMKILQDLQRNLEYEFPFIVTYHNFNRDSLNASFLEGLKNSKAAKKIPELSLQTTSQPESEGNMIYDVLNGEFDAYIEDFGNSIRLAETPVLMRLCNEMNGDWCMYSSYHTSMDTELFKEFYRYIYMKLDQCGALPYTLWVFNPNEKSMPDFKWNHQSLYYPGDEYTDIIGLTGYNTGTYYKGESWRSFDEIYIPIYVEYEKYYRNKPFMITEFASSSVGGNKELWMEDMFKSIKNYSKIKVAIWWNGRDMDYRNNTKVARPYWLDENEDTLKAFKENLKQSLTF